MTKAKVLCVDDDSFALAALSEALSDNYKVVVCSDVTEVLNVAVRVEPDLILLDMLMPEVSGTEVLELLKDFSMTRNIPVVAYTANADVLDYERLTRLGIRGLIEKSASPEQLNQWIGDVLVEINSPIESK